MKKLFLITLLTLLPQVALAGTMLFTNPGQDAFTVPVGVTQLNAVVIGGGGGGGSGGGGWGSGGGGGCGGGIAGGTLSVTPGQVVPLYVGYGGAGGNGADQCTYAGDPSCGAVRSALDDGGPGGDSGIAGIVGKGGGWGRTGVNNLFNQFSGGSGGGSGGGGGGNGWPGYYAVPGSGGSAGTQTNSQGAGGYCTGSDILSSSGGSSYDCSYYDADGNYISQTCTTPIVNTYGWAINPGTYITKSSWAAGAGGYAPAGYIYWGGGGGGGLIINGSSVKGGDGQSSPNNGGKGYGGGGGGSNIDNLGNGGAGAPGVVYLEWVTPPASCSVTFDQNPIPYGTSTTVHWSSSNATSMWINNIGYVTPNVAGSTIVSPSTTTDYSCSATQPSSDGSQTFTSSGTFTVPTFGTLTVAVNGAGGGGGGGGLSNSAGSGGYLGGTGGTGGTSSFNASVVGIGGGGGDGNGVSGTAGGASGGSTNTTGGGASGGAGGAGYGGVNNGGPGGAGGQSVSSYTPSTLATSTAVPIVVGTGGAGGAAEYPGYTSPGAAGSDGSVVITWTAGSASTSQSAILTVTPPPAPTATIAASSTSIYVGQSTGIHATFAAGSGDTLTHDNIDSPVGTGLGATTNPDVNKYITFTPVSAGTYTFFARAQTSYFTSWTTYAQTSVTVTAPPSCTPAYTCSGETIQYTNAICQVSNITACTSPGFCSPGSSICLYPPPTFNPTPGNGLIPALSGHLQAAPTLVPLATPTTLYWNISDVSTCTVSGTNGQSWSGSGVGCINGTCVSPSGGQTTATLTQQTTFTLNCPALNGTTVNESVTINIVPVFKER